MADSTKDAWFSLKHSVLEVYTVDEYIAILLKANPGYDLHRGLNASWENKGKYSTDVFTEEAETIISAHDVEQPLFLYLAYTAPHAPLQAPASIVNKFSYIKNQKRRIFAGISLLNIHE